MKKGRFLWSAHRITERQKAEKARNIKEKRTIEMFNTVLKQLVEHHSSQRDNLCYTRFLQPLQFAEAVFFCPTVVSSQLSCCGKS